ncbi:hypothetical protein D3C76_1604680 [compost metagenome]
MVGHTVVHISEIPNIISNDPKPELIRPDHVLGPVLADNNPHPAGDRNNVQQPGNSVHNIPWPADHHYAVDDTV